MPTFLDVTTLTPRDLRLLIGACIASPTTPFTTGQCAGLWEALCRRAPLPLLTDRPCCLAFVALLQLWVDLCAGEVAAWVASLDWEATDGD